MKLSIAIDTFEKKRVATIILHPPQEDDAFWEIRSASLVKTING
jgi:hypothetical protein